MKTLNHTRTFAARLLAGSLLLALAASSLADVHYVDVKSTNPTPPYTNWTTAATNIQDAVNAVGGDEVVVTNGTYSRVWVGTSLRLRSVNGPQFTKIDGGNQFRCAYLASGASLSGFTLINGFASVIDDGFGSYGGAGVKCESTNEVVSNCWITGNQVIGYLGGQIGDNVVRAYGGGAYGGTLNNCVLFGNSVSATWPASWTGQAIAQGGGAYFCTLNNCILNGNSAHARINGGSTFGTSSAQGGGAYSCILRNCTLVNNSVDAEGDGWNGNYRVEAYGGGTFSGAVYNCIAFLNTATAYPPFSAGGSSGNNFNTRGVNSSWEGDPLFAGGLRLQPNSPCINAGNNSYVTTATDLDGNPRISGGTVDIGAYEYQWPQLTITPAAVPPSGKVLTWPTNSLGYDYTGFILQSTTNLIAPVVWSTNSPAPIVIGGQNVVTNPITGPQQFYRLVH